jgi:hypothetical protein
LAFDNLSHLPPWLSDALCRLSTGGGLGTRELYSDSEELILDAQRPVILTGIEELATRGDLLDRSLVTWLPSIPKNKRRREEELDAEFSASRPALLGAFLEAVSCALREINGVWLPQSPRMADFVAWVTAAEPSLPWKRGAFLETYSSNVEAANSLSLEASVIYPSLSVLSLPFEGTATELLEKLKTGLSDPQKQPKGWPANARALSGLLRRIAPNLRRVGINVTFDRGRGQSRTRNLKIERSQPEDEGEFASAASGASEAQPDRHSLKAQVDGSNAKDAKASPFSSEEAEIEIEIE